MTGEGTESGSRPKYWTPEEVSRHNSDVDLWVSFLGKVYDLSELSKKHSDDILMEPIIAVAGTDISHWFDSKTRELRLHVDPITGCKVPYTPGGRFVHVPPAVPRADFATNFGRPWWKDFSEYGVGLLTRRVRTLRVVNTLSSQETLIDVCSEELLCEIEMRYRTHNAHTTSYTWKYDEQVLDMQKTLEENGIKDERDQFENLSIDITDEDTISEVQVYYNDDLTEG
eukprot:m.248337 g.248337  ORF g.248337 m.248337 type:complete len:227 (-) comp19503_c0_seq2:152-832(-)